MKKPILLLLIVPFVFACSSDPKIENLNSEIGDIKEGGIVYAAFTGGGGMVVTMQDIGIMNHYQAMDAVENNTTGGYDDWYLPSIYQLQTIYDAVGQGGGNIAGFEHSRYWSSTEYGGWGNGYYAFNFGTSESFIGLYPSTNARVRAIRSFE
tara:strand:+ start:70 stop:525 length:456 start_codon:yes stop_codon:yes gene_type:complete